MYKLGYRGFERGFDEGQIKLINTAIQVIGEMNPIQMAQFLNAIIELNPTTKFIKDAAVIAAVGGTAAIAYNKGQKLVMRLWDRYQSFSTLNKLIDERIADLSKSGYIDSKTRLKLLEIRRSKKNLKDLENLYVKISDSNDFKNIIS